MKKINLIIISLIILILIFLVFLINNTITGKVIKQENNKENLEIIHSNYYSYTKAICNETNFCQDYLIKCDGNKTIEIKPITGAVIQHLEDWKDPRNKEIIEKIC